MKSPSAETITAMQALARTALPASRTAGAAPSTRVRVLKSAQITPTLLIVQATHAISAGHANGRERTARKLYYPLMAGELYQ